VLEENELWVGLEKEKKGGGRGRKELGGKFEEVNAHSAKGD